MPHQTKEPAPNPYDQHDVDQHDINEQPKKGWRVLLHNDEETPFTYVIHTLSSVFMLSDELAEHIASTAHASGTAVVTVRPRQEADMLVRAALGRAKSDGYPLHFSLEQQ